MACCMPSWRIRFTSLIHLINSIGCLLCARQHFNHLQFSGLPQSFITSLCAESWPGSARPFSVGFQAAAVRCSHHNGSLPGRLPGASRAGHLTQSSLAAWDPGPAKAQPHIHWTLSEMGPARVRGRGLEPSGVTQPVAVSNPPYPVVKEPV